MSLVIKYNENKPIPEGIYLAKLAKLESSVHPQWGESIRWAFEVIDGPEAGANVTAMSSTKVSPKSKIFTWVQAFGEIMTPGTEFDLESLIGRIVRIKTKNKTTEKTVDGKPIKQTFSNVEGLAPYIPPTDTVTPPVESPVESPVGTAPIQATSAAPAAPAEVDDDASFNF